MMKEQNTAALSGHNGFSLISNEKLLQLYATMVKCRMLADRVCGLTEQGEVAGRFAMGQEAAAAGAAIDMRAEDSFAASRDGFIVNFIQGEPLKNIFKRLLAAANASELAAQLKKAMDSARASKREKNGRIALAYFGERSAAFGAWQKALTLAGKERLPIVFVCHASVRDDRFGVDEATKAALGFPCIPVDGSDVVAVYRVATEAIAHARKGNGATLIVCKAERAMAHDPIAKMEAYLTRKGIFSEAMKVEAASGFAKELNAALRAARMRRSPASSEVVGRRRNS